MASSSSAWSASRDRIYTLSSRKKGNSHRERRLPSSFKCASPRSRSSFRHFSPTHSSFHSHSFFRHLSLTHSSSQGRSCFRFPLLHWSSNGHSIFIPRYDPPGPSPGQMPDFFLFSFILTATTPPGYFATTRGRFGCESAVYTEGNMWFFVLFLRPVLQMNTSSG